LIDVIEYQVHGNIRQLQNVMTQPALP